jgi:hypothetical protein
MLPPAWAAAQRSKRPTDEVSAEASFQYAGERRDRLDPSRQRSQRSNLDADGVWEIALTGSRLDLRSSPSGPSKFVVRHGLGQGIDPERSLALNWQSGSLLGCHEAADKEVRIARPADRGGCFAVGPKPRSRHRVPSPRRALRPARRQGCATTGCNCSAKAPHLARDRGSLHPDAGCLARRSPRERQRSDVSGPR